MDHPEISVVIPLSLGSTGGIKAVIAGAIDIRLSSRPLRTNADDFLQRVRAA